MSVYADVELSICALELGNRTLVDHKSRTDDWQRINRELYSSYHYSLRIKIGSAMVDN